MRRDQKSTLTGFVSGPRIILMMLAFLSSQCGAPASPLAAPEYRDTSGSPIIRIVSPDTLDLTVSTGGTVVASYSVEGDRLRIVYSALGTQYVLNYDITMEGILLPRNNQRDLFPFDVDGHSLTPDLYKAASLEASRQKAESDPYTQACKAQLRQLGIGFNIYATDQPVFGTYPDKLSDLYPEIISDLTVFTCPRDSATLSTAAEIDTKSSYEYHPPPAEYWNRNTGELVLLREKAHLPHHHTSFMDGHVEMLTGDE